MIVGLDLPFVVNNIAVSKEKRTFSRPCSKHWLHFDETGHVEMKLARNQKNADALKGKTLHNNDVISALPFACISAHRSSTLMILPTYPPTDRTTDRPASGNLVYGMSDLGSEPVGKSFPFAPFSNDQLSNEFATICCAHFLFFVGHRFSVQPDVGIICACCRFSQNNRVNRGNAQWVGLVICCKFFSNKTHVGSMWVTPLIALDETGNVKMKDQNKMGNTFHNNLSSSYLAPSLRDLFGSLM